MMPSAWGLPNPPCWKIPKPVSQVMTVVTTYSLPTPFLQEISLSRTKAKNPAPTATRLIAVWKIPSVVKPIQSPYAAGALACNSGGTPLAPDPLPDGDAKQVSQPPLRTSPCRRAQLAEHLVLSAGPERARGRQGPSPFRCQRRIVP